tara:strand:+ start:1011 stop:1499 length:489 start_codon:yes stop_codon:yes gene_type:complete
MNVVNEIERMSPLLILIYISIGYLQGTETVQFLIGFGINNFSNHFIKNYIFKPLMKNKSFPLLGNGKRPKGAKDCGIISYGKKSTSYGMPSGHAQTIGFFLMDRLSGNYTPLYKIIVSIICIIFITSRIRLNCHTPQQTIIGTLFGFVAYKIYLTISSMFIS